MHSYAETRDLFDRTADDYLDRCDARVFNFSSLIFQRRMNLVRELIRKAPKNGAALDFGMGPAVFGQTCIDHGLRYLGVDISPVMVEKAKSMGLKDAEFVVGDLESIVQYKGAMSLVLAIGLVDYLDHPEKELENLARAVNTGGHIIISFRNRYSLPTLLRFAAKRVWRVFSRPVDSKKAFTSRNVHEHSISATRLAKLLADLGFETYDRRYINASPVFFSFPMGERFWRVWLSVDEKLASKYTRWLCSTGVIAAKRVS